MFGTRRAELERLQARRREIEAARAIATARGLNAIADGMGNDPRVNEIRRDAARIAAPVVIAPVPRARKVGKNKIVPKPA